MATPNQDSRARPIAITLLVAAGITLIGLVTKSWFSMHHGDGGVGLLGVSECFDGHCESMSWFSVRRVPGDIQLLSLVAILCVGAAIGFAVHTAAMLLKGTPERMKLHSVVPLAWIALAVAGVFFLRMELGEISHKVTISWGAFACLGGLIAIGVAAGRARSLGQVAISAACAAAPPMQQGGQMQMRPYPLAVQLGMTRYYGHVFLAPGRLFFVCTQQGGAWLQAIGQGLGGALGGALMAAAAPSPGSAPTVVDPDVLLRAVHDHPGSLIMEAPQITEIKQTLFWRLIRWNGKRLGLPQGLGRELKPAIGEWARYHGVRTTGF